MKILNKSYVNLFYSAILMAFTSFAHAAISDADTNNAFRDLISANPQCTVRHSRERGNPGA